MTCRCTPGDTTRREDVVVHRPRGRRDLLLRWRTPA
jgi:hypothetical protein